MFLDNYEKLYSKLLTIVGENGYVSECGRSDFSYLENIDINAKVQNAKETESMLVQRKAEKRSIEGDVIECLKTIRKEVLGEIRLLKNSISLIIENRNDFTAYVAADRVLIKTPLAENFEEFQVLEENLLSKDYNSQVMNELYRHKGKGLQTSLSNMIAQLLSKSLLKEFCFNGSKGRNRLEIEKRAFNQTLCYKVINSKYTLPN